MLTLTLAAGKLVKQGITAISEMKKIVYEAGDDY